MGKARILIMDDEEIIQDVLKNMLEFLGYEAEVASDGVQAIEMYRTAMEASNPFNAVIMDLTIPGGKGGRETVKDLIALGPGAKAIVSSGYSTDPAVVNFREHGFVGVISKPFKIEDLSSVLKGLL